MENRNIQPPKMALQLLRFYCKDTYLEEIEGDLAEEFAIRVKRIGSFKAKVIFWWQVISFFRPFAISEIKSPNFSNSLAMFIHYLKVALRNYSRQKLAVAINIFSLTLGIGCAVLIYLFIQNEWSYDQFHEQKDQLYRINRVVYDGGEQIVDGIEGHPMPMAQALKEDYPEILDVCRIYDIEDYIKSGSVLLKEPFYFVDSTFFELFSFPFLKGHPATALDDQASAVITKRLAGRLFGKTEPIGQTISVFFNDRYHPFQVSGVIENIPPNSTLDFELALPFQFFENHGFGKQYKDSWSISFVRTFALLQPDVDLNALHQKTIGFCDQHFTRRNSIHQQYGEESTYGEVFQPMRDIHFDPLIVSNLNEGGIRRHSYILAGIGWIILLIACINFTILAIGRSTQRVKEIGIRKVVGARARQLRFQFLGESLLLSFFGLILGIIFAQIFLPQFNDLANRPLMLNALLLPKSLLFMVGCMLLTGILAGIYPAIVLARFQPAKTISNNLKLGGTNFFTKSLVTTQFVLSIVLVVVTLVMAEQLRFMKNQDLGFDDEMLLVVGREGQDKEKFFTAYKNGLAANPNVLEVTATSPAFTHGSYRSNFEYEGKNIDYNITFVQANYLKTMGIDLVAGRNFRPGSALDSTEHMVVNQAFVDALGWDDPIGRRVEGLDNAGLENPIVIGVTNNFHFQSLEHAVSPMWMILADYSSMNDLVVKINPRNVNEVVKEMERIWNDLSSDYPFTYSFLDEDMAALYAAEERWRRIITLSGIFAIVIAFMGMYGLMALSIAGRAKEMSIRKVLGASLRKLAITLTGPFARLVLIAVVIAIPLAWYLANQWLNNFAHHISFKPGIVLLAFLLIWVLFFLAISYHIWRSSKINPVEFLRAE